MHLLSIHCIMVLDFATSSLSLQFFLFTTVQCMTVKPMLTAAYDVNVYVFIARLLRLHLLKYNAINILHHSTEFYYKN